MVTSWSAARSRYWPRTPLASQIPGKLRILARGRSATSRPRGKLANPSALNGFGVHGFDQQTRTPGPRDLIKLLKAEERRTTTRSRPMTRTAWDTMHIVKLANREGRRAWTTRRSSTRAIQSISGFQSSFGQGQLHPVVLGPTKHLGADGLCGLSPDRVRASEQQAEGAHGRTYQPPWLEPVVRPWGVKRLRPHGFPLTTHVPDEESSMTELQLWISARTDGLLLRPAGARVLPGSW